MKTFQQFFEEREVKTLILMRGVSGSGKSTVAKKLQSKLGGVIFSTDDFFTDKDGVYNFDKKQLSNYHSQNELKAESAMKKGITPIIIDNTNTQPWEMKNYVELADRYNYRVVIKQPGDDDFEDVSLEEILKRQQQRADKNKQIPSNVVHNMYTRFVPRVSLDDIRNSERPSFLTSKN